MIKVGDFGLSRDIYMDNYYRMAKTNKCPVKWMPPEMIRDGISTEKSDVVSLKSFVSFNIMCSDIIYASHKLSCKMI